MIYYEKCERCGCVYCWLDNDCFLDLDGDGFIFCPICVWDYKLGELDW